MNVGSELLKEHSRRQADKIALYACKSKGNFKKLLNCYLSDNFMLAQRAGYSLNIASKKRPEFIRPYLYRLVELLPRKDVHNAVIRNSVSIMETMQIPEKYQGKVMQYCFQFLEDHKTLPAIKAYSMTILFNLSKQYPEIKGELKTIIEDRWEHESPAFKSRGRKILAAFNKGV